MSMFCSPMEYPLRVLAKEADLIADTEVQRVEGETAQLRVIRAWKSTPDDPMIRAWTHSGII